MTKPDLDNLSDSDIKPSGIISTSYTHDDNRLIVYVDTKPMSRFEYLDSTPEQRKALHQFINQ